MLRIILLKNFEILNIKNFGLKNVLLLSNNFFFFKILNIVIISTKSYQYII